MLFMSKYLTTQLITCIGNKRKLLDFIGDGLSIVKKSLKKDKLIIFDGFAGSGVVSRYLKYHSSFLHSNDFEYYSYIVGLCYLANKSEIDFKKIKEVNYLLNKYKLNEKSRGIISELYSPKDDKNIQQSDRVFYTNKNALIIDNIRKMINVVEADLQHFFIAPLLSEASIHVNTAGVFKGFYKNSETKIGQFGGSARNCLERIEAEIKLLVPIFCELECEWKMYNEDTNKLIIKLPELDVAYYDPPYNQHPYGSNYFMLNIIAKYEKPIELSKISGIPKDWQKSNYNKYDSAVKSFNHLIKDTPAKYVLLSYNNEGIISKEEIGKIMKKYGKLDLLVKNYTVFRGGRNIKQRNSKVREILYILKKN